MTRRSLRAQGCGLGFALGTASLTLVAACGSRGPLDIDVIEIVADAAPADVGTIPLDAGADVPGDTAPDTHAPSLANCGMCLAQQCGSSIVSCVQDPACTAVFQCAGQKCFASGNTSTQCLFQCASDPGAASDVLLIVGCVQNKCGTDCTTVLGALAGGLGGFGGGGGGGRGDGG